MNKLLVIVDMINGFIKEGNLADEGINVITPCVLSYINEFKKNNYPIICFRDTHKVTDEEMNIFPIHCIEGTKECELIDELNIFKDYFIDIPKNTTNGFNTVKFKKHIEENYYSEIIVVGCCTDICIINFALSLKEYFNINNIDSKIYIPKSGVYTYNNDLHDAIKCNQDALDTMREKGIIIL